MGEEQENQSSNTFRFPKGRVSHIQLLVGTTPRTSSKWIIWMDTCEEKFFAGQSHCLHTAESSCPISVLIFLTHEPIWQGWSLSLLWSLHPASLVTLFQSLAGFSSSPWVLNVREPWDSSGGVLFLCSSMSSPILRTLNDIANFQIYTCSLDLIPEFQTVWFLTPHPDSLQASQTAIFQKWTSTFSPIHPAPSASNRLHLHSSPYQYGFSIL